MGEFAKGFDLRRKEPCDHQRLPTYFIGQENECICMWEPEHPSFRKKWRQPS